MVVSLERERQNHGEGWSPPSEFRVSEFAFLTSSQRMSHCFNLRIVKLIGRLTSLDVLDLPCFLRLHLQPPSTCSFGEWLTLGSLLKNRYWLTDTEVVTNWLATLDSDGTSLWCCLQPKAVPSNTVIATCGYWAPETWRVGIEMCWKYKMPLILKTYWEKNVKCLINYL